MSVEVIVKLITKENLSMVIAIVTEKEKLIHGNSYRNREGDDFKSYSTVERLE